MATLDELLLAAAVTRAKAVIDPLEEKADDLRREVAMYDSPHWAAFEDGLRRTLVETLWSLVNEDDAAMTRVFQLEARRLRAQLERPVDALNELKQLNEDIEAERNSVLADAALTGDPGRRG